MFLNIQKIYSNYLRHDEVLGYGITISRHIMRLWDHFLRFSHYGEVNGSYYTIQSLETANKRRYPGNDVLFNYEVSLSELETEQSRKIFGWLDLLGKLGGITNVCMMLFGFFLFPQSPFGNKHPIWFEIKRHKLSFLRSFIAWCRSNSFCDLEDKASILIFWRGSFLNIEPSRVRAMKSFLAAFIM